MGWSGGTDLFEKIIHGVKRQTDLDYRARVQLYSVMFLAFEDADWDNADELEGIDPAYDEVYRGLYPEEDEDDEVDYNDGGNYN